MRTLLVVCALATLLPTPAAAQALVERPASTWSLGGVSSALSLPEQSLNPRMPANPRARCCNTKGALIGAGIGAGVATWLTRSLCDAGDCTGNYIKAGAVLGAIGAGIGALIHPRRSGASPSRDAPSISVTPVIARRGRGVIVAARF